MEGIFYKLDLYWGYPCRDNTVTLKSAAKYSLSRKKNEFHKERQTESLREVVRLELQQTLERRGFLENSSNLGLDFIKNISDF